MKGVSALISTVIMIALVFGLGAILSPWINTLTRDVTNQTSTTTLQQVFCRSAAYDFDTSFATSGISNNITNTTTDSLAAKVVNTGTVNLHAFSFEIEITPTGKDREIKQIPVNASSQKTESLPLKPGQSVILRANFSEDLNGTVHNVKILNGVCPEKFIDQDI